MNVAAFDFVGCGNSDPDNLTYGINEVYDIRSMLEEVRKHIDVGKVTIWGRSMGSLCAIIFADMYSYEVDGLVLDSPFKSLSSVIDRVASRNMNLPSFLLSPVLYFIKKKAAEEAAEDIFNIDYLSIFRRLHINLPILFVFSNFDFIVPA